MKASSDLKHTATPHCKTINMQSGFIPELRCVIRGAGKGSLEALTFAVKDNIDVMGYKTGGGNPYWASTAKQAFTSCYIVDELLNAGASLMGKTITEELAFSLIGNNKHFGSPRNGASPLRFTGGSSSGSASVVSCGEVDFALGTDTAGSIRVPASNCGLYGFRPSYGYIDMQGVLPLASSFDTLGWMSSDITVLAQVTNVLVPNSVKHSFTGYWLYEPALTFLTDELKTLFLEGLHHSTLPCLGNVATPTCWTKDNQAVVQAFCALQAKEAWEQYKDWLQDIPENTLADDISARFYIGKEVNEKTLQVSQQWRKKTIIEFETLIDEYGVLAIPTVSKAAPYLEATPKQLQSYRENIIQITCLSSLTGLPEITLPLMSQGDAHLGISLIGRRGEDKALVQFVADNLYKH